MSNVTFSDVRKSYGAVEVLHGVSLEIFTGEFVALVGPSGCGKSTLLRMVAGLEEVTGGAIAIDEEVINDLAPRHRDIAMVFQNYALYPHMSVASNMAFALKMRKFPRDEIDGRVNEAARILGLEGLLHRKPRALSGGQRQRVAMGRAIVRQPKLFLFDEPLSNLDAKLRVQMRSELKELHQRLNITTIFVTHDQIEAMTLSDRVVIMNSGVIEQIGEPLELYHKPASLFVAAFIGSPPMNLFPGTLDGSARFTLQDGTQLDASAMRIAHRGALTLGIRPEDFRIGDHGWPATVSVVEPMGPETQVSTRLAGELVRVMVRGHAGLRPGDEIFLSASPEQVHVFDTATGARMD